MEAGDGDEMAADGEEVLMKLGAIAAIAGMLVTAVVVAGCGGSSSVGSLDDVAQAAAKTSHRGSFRSSLHMTMSVAGIDVNVDGDGVYDTQKKLGQTTMDMGNLSQVAGRDLGTMTLVQSGTVIYMRWPVLQQQLPGGKPWVKVDLQEAGKKMGLDFSAMMQLGAGGSPATMLQNLRAAGDLKRVGTEEVRGAHTTHYHVIVDLRKVPDTVPQRLRARIRASTETVIQMTGQSRVPEDLWIGDDGLVRRLQLDQRIPVGSTRGKLKMTMDLFDFGTPVAVTLPPASQVTDLSDLAPSGAG
jgi:hypothetical protein